MELPPPPPTEALGDAPVSEVAPPAAPETADEESQEAKDIQKVYAMRDAIMKGATDQGVETKEGLLDLFMARALDAADESGDMKVVPRASYEELLGSFGIDVTEASVAWITSHFVIGDEAAPSTWRRC
ncbi:hypothetical protein M885DRAFT_270737 [Pelagophyceae sp. CCMP2097]|nr:hypothetical protein M885DRAFT_270737 [Pelagophyceae sp. CCMP2097]